MKKVTAILLAVVLLLSLSFGTLTFALADEAPDGQVTIFHTNDMHGRFAPTSSAIGIDTIAAIFESAPNALLVDAGDTFHGQLLVGLSEGLNAVELMNLAGYSLFTPGNHDFNYGTDRLLELMALADFGFLSANIYRNGEPLFDATSIVEIGGLRLGFFGLAHRYTATLTHPNNVVGVTFADPIASAAAPVAALVEAEVDVIIALTHLGSDVAGERRGEDAAVLLAEAFPEIHLIIDAHSHTVHPNGHLVGDTVIAQAGAHGTHLGRIDISVDADGEVSVTASVITREYALENFEPLPHITAALEEMAAEIDELTSEVVGYSPVNLYGDSPEHRPMLRGGEVPLGNLVADSMRWDTDADFTLTNSGGIREHILAGEILMRDAIATLPFFNYVVVLEITPAVLWETLEIAVSAWPAAHGRFPQVSGFSFTFDGYAEPFNRIRSVVTEDGDELDPQDDETVFTIAVNDFMAAGGDDFTTLIDLPTALESSAQAEVLIAYLQEVDLTTVEVEGRIVQVGQPPEFMDVVNTREENGVLYLRLIDIINWYDASVEWDGETRTVTITSADGETWYFVIGYRGSFLDYSIGRTYISYEHFADMAF